VAEDATKKKLGIGVGLQRHHQKGYLESLKKVKAGAIGEITSGRVFWMQAALWNKGRKPTWTDMEWQIRNWLYFTWLSGDHIVEQHIHNIDIAQWFIGKPPESAVGMGGRQQRIDPAYGHIYDHFAVDYTYPNDVHVLSMCRQIPGCQNGVSEHLRGTKGRIDMGGKGWAITSAAGKEVWSHDGSKDVDPYIQEHTDLIDSIRKGKPLNELKAATESNLAAIMGRMSAYTGKKVTWDQALNSKEDLFPKELKFGKIEVAKVAIPGTTDVI
jgi:predicted dehydrogenase